MYRPPPSHTQCPQSRMSEFLQSWGRRDGGTGGGGSHARPRRHLEQIIARRSSSIFPKEDCLPDFRGSLPDDLVDWIRARGQQPTVPVSDDSSVAERFLVRSRTRQSGCVGTRTNVPRQRRRRQQQMPGELK
mmetsp:Transcript_124013/g.396503  ORF Transcript_124013/g.396503 Transcript_124013/m.396503 type:complete len:132 (+) Transcript_124013:82-477(+)